MLCLTLRRQQDLMIPDFKEGNVIPHTDGAIPGWVFIPAVHISPGFFHILGHFPVEAEEASRAGEIHFHSRVLDSIPFAFNPSADESELVMDRLRLVTAVLALQTQCIRLSALWDDVVWPSAVIGEDMHGIRREFGIPEDSVRVPNGASPGRDYQGDPKVWYPPRWTGRYWMPTQWERDREEEEDDDAHSERISGDVANTSG